MTGAAPAASRLWMWFAVVAAVVDLARSSAPTLAPFPAGAGAALLALLPALRRLRSARFARALCHGPR